jgi:ferredoxin
MSAQVETATALEAFLNNYDEQAWSLAVAELLPSIHEVDRNATQIWFKFYPLSLLRALEKAEDPARLVQQLSLQGNYYLKDQIDSSHHFLYGHRYWPEVKKAVTQHADNFQANANADLSAQIIEIARQVAAGRKVQESLLAGITAVAFMTLQQVGIARFAAAPGSISIDARHARKSAEQVLKERARDDGQGLLGFLKTVDKKWTVTFDETDEGAKYKLTHTQDLAYGAAGDRSRDWKAIDPRRIEGPIPVECRSAACGTCWVGVLGGAEKLSEVGRREGTRIKEFGYIETDEPRPLIRLACQAQAHGAVSIVIPPWNGVFGKALRRASPASLEQEGGSVNPQAGEEQ